MVRRQELKKRLIVDQYMIPIHYAFVRVLWAGGTSSGMRGVYTAATANSFSAAGLCVWIRSSRSLRALPTRWRK